MDSLHCCLAFIPYGFRGPFIKWRPGARTPFPAHCRLAAFRVSSEPLTRGVTPRLAIPLGDQSTAGQDQPPPSPTVDDSRSSMMRQPRYTRRPAKHGPYTGPGRTNAARSLGSDAVGVELPPLVCPRVVSPIKGLSIALPGVPRGVEIRRGGPSVCPSRLGLVVPAGGRCNGPSSQSDAPTAFDLVGR